jgi:hypothetical protein
MSAKVSNKSRGNGHWTSSYMPLQENQGGEAGKGILIGAELGSVVVLRIEVDKWLEEEEVPPSLVLQQHKNDTSMRNTEEERTGD